jgi:sialate O-acetylesterase
MEFPRKDGQGTQPIAQLPHLMIHPKTFLVILGSALACQAELKPAPVFTDHMVLQQGIAVPIWGRASAEEKVIVSFGSQTVTTRANAAGDWRAEFPPLPPSTKPAVLRFRAGSDEVELSDVVVGDVWICSGQSNMAFLLSKCVDGKADAEAASDALLRLNTTGGWTTCTGKTALNTSGVAYYFARLLRDRNPNVPIGLLQRAVGGTPVEFWTPADKLTRVPFCKETLERFQSDDGIAAKIFAYNRALNTWKRKVKAEGREKAGIKPEPAADAATMVLAGIYDPKLIGRLWTQHLAPVAGYAIRGAIWYQGERNSKAGEACARAYRPMLANLITSWREAWQQGDFPFYTVQLPTFAGGGPAWKIVQEAQAQAVRDVPNAGYVDIRDLPDDGLHPKDKKPVGERLARLALKSLP